jgi:hypothetical protein
MNNSPRYCSVAGHRVRVEVANDPPFRFLAEAYEGRSRTAVRNDQRSSSWNSRQHFLDLVRGKVPKADVKSQVATIDAATLHYDQLADIGEADFIFLDKLLRFLKEFKIIEDRTYAPVAEELKFKISIKAGTFDSYLFEWNKGTQKESFKREVILAAEAARRIHASKKKALERRASRREEQRHEQEGVGEPPLREEFQTKEPVSKDLRRLSSEERALVHPLNDTRHGPVNWIALAGETFKNQLVKKNYEKLAELEKQAEQSENYHTPPGSSMHE